MNALFRALFALLLIFGFVCLPSTQAKAAGMTQINWIALWGNIDPETGIPTEQHEIKNVIASAVDRCGVGNTNYSLIKIYKSASTLGSLYFIDASPYFKAGQATDCTGKPCTGTGCYLTVKGPEITTTSSYTCEKPVEETPTETSEAAEETPEESVGEESTETETETCTKTTYQYPTLKDQRVLSWSLMSLGEYDLFRTHALDALGNPKYRAAYNGTNPILKTQLASGCTIDEMDTNNDGAIDAGELCYKYSQLNGSAFQDLYSPISAEEVENDARYTITYYDRENAQIESGSNFWRSIGIRLETNSELSLQLPDFQGTGEVLCKNVENVSKNSYFVPTKTDEEVDAFLKAAEAGTVDGVSVSDCTRKYTDWVGTLVCPSVSCGQTVTIVAQRFCQRSSSAYGNCDECGPEICFLKRACSGGECGGGGDVDCIGAQQTVLMADGSYKNIAAIKVGDMVLGFKKEAPLAALTPARVKAILKTDLSKAPAKKAFLLNGIAFTGNHMIPASTTQGFLRAKDVKKTSALVGISGQVQKVTTKEEASSVPNVYNLKLENADGYVVNGLRIYGGF